MPPTLHLDYVWADDAAIHSQKLLRQLLKHLYVTDYSTDNTSLPTELMAVEQEESVLMFVLQSDVSARLVQFRASIEADAAVSKRLYLVKCEYRTPFRAFLEAHTAVQRAPSLGLVDEFLALPSSKVEQRRISCKDRLQKLLQTPELTEALALEQKLEEFEVDVARALYPFAEMARYLDYKRARVNSDVPGATELQACLRRLRGILCRRAAGPDQSVGIRPLLLDLQGVPRDDDEHKHYRDQADNNEEAVLARLERLIEQLQQLAKLCRVRNAFRADSKSVEVPNNIAEGCKRFDHELFSCQVQDWFAMVRRQHELTESKDFDRLAEKLRRAEVQMSLAVATEQSLQVVRQRLEVLAADREKRFEVCQEMIEEVCLREMNLYVTCSAPDSDNVLQLQPTSAKGIFGMALQLAGEPIPLG
jgi:hypothetical protein